MPKLLSRICIALLGVCLIPATVWAQADICDSQTTWALVPPPVGQDPPFHMCCVYEFWAGNEIGWAASVVHNGRPLDVADVNGWTLRLYEAAHGIQGANACCSERNLAWPGWYNMQEALYRLAQDGIRSCGPNPQGSPTCEAFCMGAWVELTGMLAAYGNVLGPMQADTPARTVVESFSNCDQHYFKLGYRLAYAHYRLQAGDRDESDKHVREAIRHVRMLEDCSEIPPWSGYCVNVWHPQLIVPDLNLLLDRNRLPTPQAVGVIFNDVIGEIARVMMRGDRPLNILRCPGTDFPTKPCCSRFVQGLSRASQRLASRPIVAVPPPPFIGSIVPPAPTQSSGTQTLTVNGSGFQNGLTATLFSPNGSSSPLNPSQVQSTSFQLLVTLNSTGTWGIRATNPDRGQSNTFNFTVGASPSPAQTYNLSGTWQPAGGGPDKCAITGGTTRYTLSLIPGNTAADKRSIVKNEGSVTGDGQTFEGSFRDVPGYCCGRDGYVWIEVIDENTYRTRSVWWAPGHGSKEEPQLTFGWSTWKRAGPAATVAPSGSPPDEGNLDARRKALGQKLDDIRKAGNWHPDHHYQVGIFIGNSRTAAQLDAVETLMHEYAGCYQTVNAERAKIAEAAKAGQYRTPGDRIGALDQVQGVFDKCMSAAHSRYVAARNR